MKKISAGVIILNNKNQILGCKPFGKSDGRCDIPKGGVETGETKLEAAIREVMEETNLNLLNVEMEELGLYEYRPKKDLYLFKCQYEIEDISILKCTSYFELNGTQFPEMTGYEWIDINQEILERRFYRSLGPILSEILLKKC